MEYEYIHLNGNTTANNKEEFEKMPISIKNQSYIDNQFNDAVYPFNNGYILIALQHLGYMLHAVQDRAHNPYQDNGHYNFNRQNEESIDESALYLDIIYSCY